MKQFSNSSSTQISWQSHQQSPWVPTPPQQTAGFKDCQIPGTILHPCHNQSKVAENHGVGQKGVRKRSSDKQYERIFRWRVKWFKGIKPHEQDWEGNCVGCEDDHWIADLGQEEGPVNWNQRGKGWRKNHFMLIQSLNYITLCHDKGGKCEGETENRGKDAVRNTKITKQKQLQRGRKSKSMDDKKWWSGRGGKGLQEKNKNRERKHEKNRDVGEKLIILEKDEDWSPHNLCCSDLHIRRWGFFHLRRRWEKNCLWKSPRKMRRRWYLLLIFPSFLPLFLSFPNHQTYQTTTKWMVIFLIGLIFAFRRVARFFNINIFNFKKENKTYILDLQ